MAEATIQLLVHLYFTIALRISNSHLFEGRGNDEGKWGFGQILAVAMVTASILEFMGGYLSKYTSLHGPP